MRFSCVNLRSNLSSRPESPCEQSTEEANRLKGNEDKIEVQCHRNSTQIYILNEIITRDSLCDSFAVLRAKNESKLTRI